MNQSGPDTPDAIPTALRGLWSEACDWVAWLVSTFAAHPLGATGVKRETGARLSIWLGNIEGAVRRLVLAAALALTPPASRHTPAIAAPAQPSTAKPRRPGFRVFHLRGAHTATSHARIPPHAMPAPYGHIRFPADPLLTLGVARIATRPAPLIRQRNPLDRWVRPSRNDPDWRPSPNDGELMFSAPPLLLWRAPRPPEPRPQRAPHDPNALPPSLADWRRRHDEWQRLIPAPDLAMRLDALARIAANPHVIIARAARRLHRAHNLDPGLRAAAPRDRLPRRARHIETAGHTFDFNERTHTALARLDSS